MNKYDEGRKYQYSFSHFFCNIKPESFHLETVKTVKGFSLNPRTFFFKVKQKKAIVKGWGLLTAKIPDAKNYDSRKTVAFELE